MRFLLRFALQCCYCGHSRRRAANLAGGWS